eukprot:575247-Amphidinium_carterae.1
MFLSIGQGTYCKVWSEDLCLRSNPRGYQLDRNTSKKDLTNVCRVFAFSFVITTRPIIIPEILPGQDSV